MTERNRRHVPAVVFLATAALAACGEGGGTPESVGIVDDSAFFVQVINEQKYPFYLHQATAFESKCEIDAEARDQDITCYVEMNEQDIYFQTVSLQYNVPTKMCDYVGFSNYYYYNFEIGRGPREVLIDRFVDASGGLISATCEADGVPCADPESDPTQEITLNVSADAALCVYDLKNVSTFLPNCCFGPYTQTVVTHAPTTTTTQISRSKWGGNLVECLSGPAATDDTWPKTAEGRPRELLYFTANTGLNQQYNIKPPIEISGHLGSYHTANHFTPGRHNHQGLRTPAVSSTLPYAMDPIDDRSGSVINGAVRVGPDIYAEDIGLPTQDSYEWRCYDKAREVINRIRVYVREWNTQAELATFGETQGTSGNPDVVGAEASDCNYNLSLSQCNDLGDWDDFLYLPNGSVTTYNVRGLDERPFFFPFEPKAVSAPTQ